MVAQATKRVQIGPTVTNPLTRHPAVTDTDYLADRIAVVGTPEGCREKVRVIEQAGVDTLIITAIGTRPGTIIQRFGDAIISQLQ